MTDFYTIILSLLGLVMLSIIFLVLQRLLKLSKLKITLVIIIFIIGFVIYFIGYYEKDKQVEAFAKALLAATQMLVLNNNLDSLTNPIIIDNPLVLLLLSILSVFVFGILAQALIITLFKDLKTKIRFRTSRSKSYFLFYGYTDDLDQMICDLSKKQENVVIESSQFKEKKDLKMYHLFIKNKIIQGTMIDLTPQGLTLKTKWDTLIFVPRLEVIDHDFDLLLASGEIKPINLFVKIVSYDQNRWIGSNFEVRLLSKEFFIIDTENHRDEIISKGYPFLSSQNPLPKVYGQKHMYLFYLTNHDQVNIKAFKETYQDQANFTYYVRLQDSMIQDALLTSYERSNIHVIQDAHIISTSILNLYPIHDAIEPMKNSISFKNPFKSFIGGLSHIGYHLLKHMIMHGQSIDQLPSILFHDTKLSESLGRIHTEMPEIYKAAIINSMDTVIGSPSYYDMLIDGLPYHYVCFTYDDDAINLSLAIGFKKRLSYHGIKKYPIILCLQRHIDDTLVNTYGKTLDGITLFGSNKSLLNLYDILQDRLNQHAKLYAYAYQFQKKAENPAYQISSFYEKDPFTASSNKAVYLHIPMKLKLLGLSIEQAKSMFESIEDFKSYIDHYHPHALDRLSELEHLRWNAFHFVHGWSTLSIDEALKRKKEIESNKLSGTATKDMILKKHICLVPYGELKELESLFQAQYRLYDTQNVLNIIQTIKIHE